METKPCACGCGTQIPAKDSRGRTRSYAFRHGRKGRSPAETSITQMRQTKKDQFVAQYAGSVRTCSYCEQERDLAEFYLPHKEKYQARCRTCRTVNRLANKYSDMTERELLDILAQDACEICGGAAGHIDHDHSTNRVRGNLCRDCNLSIGFMHDDPDRLLAAAAYLLKTQSVLGEISV